MAGHFINTSRKDATISLVKGAQDFLKNPYYVFSDKKPTPVKYYNMNTQMSTIDDGLKIAYSNLGTESPLRFNVIDGLFIYGLPKIDFSSLDFGDKGLEAEIEGEGIIMPNTITPYPGDYFEIEYTDTTYLFKILTSRPDTLDDGANMWSITYKLDRLENSNILPLVVERFVFSITNVGTKFNPVIQQEKYSLAEKLDGISITLKNYFKELFYDQHIQSFSFEYATLKFMYDPFLIEFIIRNEILKNNGGEYLLISHKLPVPKTFSIDYSNTIYRYIELKEKAIRAANISSAAEYIDNPMSIFVTRFEDYFYLNYKQSPNVDSTPMIQVFDCTVIDNIFKGKLFTEENMLKYNIIIKYFNDQKLTLSDLEALEKICFTPDNTALFFLIPMLIFCIEDYIKQLIS